MEDNGCEGDCLYVNVNSFIVNFYYLKITGTPSVSLGSRCVLALPL